MSVFKTEEDIKAKLLLPYLKDLGIDVSEIQLEDSFSIRLGRNIHKTGFSDILCKRHGKNLFIIELKKDSSSINQDDIDQGISYARLLRDDIAPFTIITNGKETKIFDSVSRNELSGHSISSQSAFWKNDYTLSIQDDLRIRYEALRNFIALSPENLKLFCKSQIIDRMGTLIGDIDSPYSKFVKDLHIQRKDLQNEFKNFITSKNSIFGLIGSAGVGKTSAICSLALQNVENKFVFFYNSSLIKSPLESISQDLNITFSSRTETDVVLKKLNELGRYANKSILLFIDAVDESTNTNIAIELSEVALLSKNLDNIKIVVSCKTNIWSSILREKNNPTHLYEELRKTHKISNESENLPGFLLTDFTDDELHEILPVYQKAFNFKGQISNSILSELRNGFFLKIFSEVYSGKKVPEKINDKDLINKYLKQSLSKTSISALSWWRILSAIGKIILNHEYNSREAFDDEGLDAIHLLEKLNFSLDEGIPEDLFSRNILIKSNNDDSYNVSFYYSKIRDYIICYHSYKLNQLNNTAFYKVLGDFYQNHVGISAIDFYVENASSTHRSILENYKKDMSLRYVMGYQNYIHTHFEVFKNKFDPYTSGDIGILLPEDLINNDGYALFPVDLNLENRVQYADINNESNRELYFKKKANTFYGSNTLLLKSNQEITIRNNIFNQLRKIIEKGRISAYSSDILLLEKISLIMYYHHEDLGYNFSVRDYRLPRFDAIYPIDLNDVLTRVIRFKFTQYYRRTTIDRDFIKIKVEKAIRENDDIPIFDHIGQVPPFEELHRIVEILQKKGYNQIEKHHLPMPDISIAEAEAIYRKDRSVHFGHIRVAQFSKPQAKLYIEEFFSHLESCYKEFVEHCFPTLKDNLLFYKRIPHEYFFYLKDSDVLKWGSFGYRASANDKIKFNFRDTDPLHNAFDKDGIECLRGFFLDYIIKVPDSHINQVQTVDRIKTPEIDDFCVIRNWIYKILNEDLRDLFKEVED